MGWARMTEENRWENINTFDGVFWYDTRQQTSADQIKYILYEAMIKIYFVKTKPFQKSTLWRLNPSKNLLCED